MKDFALAYANRGWYIFPIFEPVIHADGSVTCSCGEADCENPGKHPRTKQGLKDATTDESIIVAWWKKWPNANIGIATGAISGFIALDNDPGHGGDASIRELQDAYGELPETVQQRTGSGGAHDLFKHPGIRVPNSIGANGWLGAAGLDIRGDGGYIVAPPSLHRNGARYAWHSSADPESISLAAMPSWMLAMLKAKQTAPVQPAPPLVTVGLPAYFEKAINDECVSVAMAMEGTRNDQLNTSALKLGQFIHHGVDRRLIESRLADAGRRCGLKESEITRTIKSGIDAGEKQPRQIAERQPASRKSKGASHDVQQQAISPVVVNLGSVVARKTEWLWPGRIPFGYITLLVGRPGEGKSFFTIDLGSRISTGSPWPDGRGEAPFGSVLFISLEDSAEIIRLRADAHHADASKLSLMCMLRRIDNDGKPVEIMFTLGHLFALESALEQIPDCRAIIIDPIGSVLGGDTDAHRDNEVRSVLAPLAAIADKRKLAVLVVAHRRKNGGSHADDLALGSRAFTGIARVVMHLSRDPQDKSRRLLLPGKNNLAPEGDGLAFTIAGEPAALRWERDAVAMNADEALAAEQAENQPGPEPEARNQAVEWLTEFLATGPKATKDVKSEAKDAGFAWRTIWRAKASLSIKTYREQFGGGWSWRLIPPKCATESANCASLSKGDTLGTLGTLGEINQKNEAHNTFLTRGSANDAKYAKLSTSGDDVAQMDNCTIEEVVE